ncbi:MAG: UDP-N-acetylglucosamine--N-acetylmuramyl-(pentapeptide) pyrophosphoryl-undecaprenol N-acetylglucosamine transferase, partial [Dongiaceae bacterium]
LLADRLGQLLVDPARLTAAAVAARRLGHPDAAARLADLVLSLLRGNGAERPREAAA